MSISLPHPTKTPDLERFEHFLIAGNAKGGAIQLARSPGESVFLAFDLQAKRLTELHVLRGPAELNPAEKLSAHERAVQAAELRGGSFLRILEVGEDDGLIYYSSTLNDGEFVEDYIARRGALPPATAFCLLLQLLDDLVELQSYHRLVSHLSLKQLLVTTLEDTFLQLRVVDFGLAQKERRSDDDLKRLSFEVCELIFLLLTGRPHGGENPDKYPALTCLASGLRSTLRNVLADKTQAPATLDRLRDDVKEAFTAMVSNLQTRGTRKHLVVTNESLLPKSQLQDLLLENVALDTLLNGRFTVENSDTARRYPFSIPARNARNDQPITVHLLPPSRIVPKDQYEAVPLQMWRFDARRHPNILRSLSVWESPDWTFLTEEREGGFALSRLIAERITLNPTEVLLLLKQARDGIAQALECGVARVDLHPSNMVLQLVKNGALPSREFERLMQKRVDAWAPFCLKLRPHLTMRSLYEPLLSDRPEDESEFDAGLRDEDFRSRSFVALAAYMLTGERLIGRGFEFPESVPQALADYINASLALGRKFGTTPPPEEFVAGFETHISAGGEGGLSPAMLRGPTVALADMESAGSVSDFEGDSDGQPAARTSPPPRPGLRRFPATAAPPRRRMGPVLILSALGVGLVLVLASLFSGQSTTEPEPDTGGPAGVDGGPATQPNVKPQGTGKRVVVEIHKAIVPTADEIEAFRREQAAEAAAVKVPVMPADKAPGVLADHTAN